MSYKRLFTLFALAASVASGHTIWLENTPGKPHDYRVVFNGHGGRIEAADGRKLKSFEALDAAGKALKVTRSDTPEGVKLHVDGDAALIAAYFDNGIHSRKATGPTIEAPMNEVPGALRATYAPKYHKTIVSWNPVVSRALGQPFEVVPVESTQPVAGEPFRVRVLEHGKPVAGVRLGAGEDAAESAPVTDTNGVAVFIPASGFNKLWAGKRVPIAGNPAYTELSYEYLLGFTAK